MWERVPSRHHSTEGFCCIAYWLEAMGRAV
jgi:hypothetical protein